MAAPRSRGGKWQICPATEPPVDGDCMLVILGWVGTFVVGHEALRRGDVTPPLCRLTGAVAVAPPMIGLASDGGPSVNKLGLDPGA